VDPLTRELPDIDSRRLIDDKASYESSVRAIVDVVQSVRTHEPVAAR
jgi:hypothetical protein